MPNPVVWIFMVFKWLGYAVFGNPARRLYYEFYRENPLALFPVSYTHYRTRSLEGTWSKWRRCVLVVMGDGLSVYPNAPQMTVDFRCLPDELRWFGRPEKYTDGINHILIHAEIHGRWHILEIQLFRYDMQRLVRALKQIATEEQVKAYRRRPPHIHYGPLTVRPAHQDIHGAWELEPPLTFYLMPAFAVIADKGAVLRIIPMEKIQQIQALRRLDAPNADGLVRFQVEGETMAYATPEYQTLALQLADAARRTLEEPILQKRKKKPDEDEDDLW